MKKNVICKSGFTLVEIMIVVAIIGLLATIAMPNLVKARTTSQANACINNLRQIDAAKQEWALETGQKSDASPDGVTIQPYLGRGQNGVLPYCPIDQTKSFASSYLPKPVNLAPVCRWNDPSTGITNHMLVAY